MSDFTTFFSDREQKHVPKSFPTLDSIFRNTLNADHVQSKIACGASILLTKSFGQEPQFYEKKDGSGWIVIKGIIFNIQTKIPNVDFDKLLGHFLNEEIENFNDYEGSFALAAWDAKKKKAWVVNDQASMMNLYFGEHEKGLYVTTNALSLARSLGLKLDPYAVQQLLVRIETLAPASMFSGLQRMNIGEHICYKNKMVVLQKHWSGYEATKEYHNINEAANAIASKVVDRLSRFASNKVPLLCDLTGGYDSRLIACAAHAANLDFAVTVNGPPDLDDVQIGKLVAQKMNWEMEYFNTNTFWTEEISSEIRRELTYRTNGELRFNDIYHQLSSRPILNKNYNIHVIGGGGELLRYFPWSQEFFNIGRRKLANIDNALNYRYLPDKNPVFTLFKHDWYPAFCSLLRKQIERICNEQSDQLTTQQLDAVYLQKKTANPALHLSSAYNWLPTVSPLLTAGVIKAAISVPWRMRLTSRLQRMIILNLSQSAAKIKTTYGGPAEPLQFKNLHKEFSQFINRFKKLTNKLEKKILKNLISKHINPVISIPRQEKVPFMTDEFKSFLNPDKMFSRSMYDPRGLKNILNENGFKHQKNYSLILRIATLETLCQELRFKPDSDFLKQY